MRELMRAGWLTTVVATAGFAAATGCIAEFEAPSPEACRLDAPVEVGIDEAFVVEVRCVDEPASVEFDFGDDSGIARSSALVREHVYAPGAASRAQWRVQAFVVDRAGGVQRLEATIERRF